MFIFSDLFSCVVFQYIKNAIALANKGLRVSYTLFFKVSQWLIKKCNFVYEVRDNEMHCNPMMLFYVYQSMICRC